MAQNVDPAAAGSGAVRKGNESGTAIARGSVSKRCPVTKEFLLFLNQTIYSGGLEPLMALLERSVYEGLRYKLSLEFPSGYPYNPPTVKFLTSCYHPNVDGEGNICLDILKDKWSALYDVRTILLSIQSLLGEPNVQSPLNVAAAQLWSNQQEYKLRLHEAYARQLKS